MSTGLIILLMAVVTYVPRLAGFLLSEQNVSSFWLRFLHFVPIAVFAALISPALLGIQGEGNIRLLAAFLAAIIIWRSESLWLGIVSGMAAFWLLRVIL